MTSASSLGFSMIPVTSQIAVTDNKRREALVTISLHWTRAHGTVPLCLLLAAASREGGLCFAPCNPSADLHHSARANKEGRCEHGNAS